MIQPNLSQMGVTEIRTLQSGVMEITFGNHNGFYAAIRGQVTPTDIRHEFRMRRSPLIPKGNTFLQQVKTGFEVWHESLLTFLSEDIILR